MATTIIAKPTSAAPPSYTPGAATPTPYGSFTPAQGANLLRQSVQWQTEEQIRQAQLRNLRLGAAAGATGGYGGGGGGGGGGYGGLAGIYAQMQTRRGTGQSAKALKTLVESYNRAYEQARQANEQRYREMLGIVGETTSQRQADIEAAYGQREAGIMQQLARTGMAGTTVAPTMGLGVEREKQAALDRLADALQGTRLGIMERRTDEYPQLQQILSLATAAGAAPTSQMGTILKALSGLTLGGQQT